MARPRGFEPLTFASGGHSQTMAADGPNRCETGGYQVFLQVVEGQFRPISLFCTRALDTGVLGKSCAKSDKMTLGVA